MHGVERIIGYAPGVIGRIAELHATYYTAHWGFGSFFEAKVATDLASFINNYDSLLDRLWSVRIDDRIEGGLAIHGSEGSGSSAHLRWFILSDTLRNAGVGNHLMHLALAFCRDVAFDCIYLWTFDGLTAARHLYEKFGFTLTEEHVGTQWGTPVTEQRFVCPAPFPLPCP